MLKQAVGMLCKDAFADGREAAGPRLGLSNFRALLIAAAEKVAWLFAEAVPSSKSAITRTSVGPTDNTLPAGEAQQDESRPAVKGMACRR